MRKIITILLILASTFGYSQTVQTLTIQTQATTQVPIASPTQSGLVKIGSNLFINANGTVIRLGGSVGTSAVLSQLNNTTNFATFNVDTATIVFVTDTITRGIFSLYTGTDSADGGMIFNDALSRKWKRLTKDNKIYLRWYNVYPFTDYVGNVSVPFKKARDYILKHQNQFQILQLDPCIFNTWYKFDETMDITGIKLYGAGGQGRKPSTRFNFRGDIPCFTITGGYTEVKDVEVTNGISASIYDSASHSFIIKGRVRFENVYIPYNRNGNGYQIIGDDSINNPRYSVFINCQALTCNNGGYIKGKYAGNIIFELCNFAQNNSWGMFDIGEIGNIYLTTHFASNSQVNNSGARTADIRTFYPYPDSVYNIIGKHPDSFPTYWYRTNFTGSNQLFDSTRKYYGGGALYANHPNARNQVISVYTEDFQANSIINDKSTWYEGTAGSPIRGGMWQHTFGNNTFFSSTNGIQADTLISNMLSYNFIVNGADAAAVLYNKSPATQNNEHILPDESGYIASGRLTEKTGDPTLADIPLNTWIIWSKTTAPASLKLWANLNGTLRLIKTY